DTHRDRLQRHVVLAEEVGCRVAARERVECDDPRTALEARAGLVEPDVTGLADAEDLEVDTARITDRLLIALRLRLDLLARHVAPREVDVLRLDVHAVEQVLFHVAPEAVDAVR